MLDDNRSFLDGLSKEVKRELDELHISHSIRCCGSSKEVTAMLEAGDVFNLLITDIDLDEERDGISLAQQINKSFPKIKIIYMTAYNDFSHDISDSNFVYYLVKPIREDKLRSALKKANDALCKERGETVLLKNRDAVSAVEVCGIVYVESVGHRALYHLSDGEEISVRERLDAVDKSLAAYQSFLRVHKSFLVNMAFIAKVAGADVILNSGRIIPVSRGNIKAVKSAFSAYLMRNME